MFQKRDILKVQADLCCKCESLQMSNHFLCVTRQTTLVLSVLSSYAFDTISMSFDI